MITSVNGKLCQYWLPSAYGVKASGMVSPGRVNVMVENPGDVAELIIAFPSQLSERPSVQQRRWSDSHVAGVAVGFDTIDHAFTSIHERSFVKLNVGKGSTGLILK